MTTVYNKTTTDFASEPNAINISISDLYNKINGSMITVALEYVNKVNTEFSFAFFSALGETDLAILNNLVANYTITTFQNIVAVVSETQASGTDGGTFTSGAWRTRNLNTTIGNFDFLSLDTSAHQITIQPGRYYVIANFLAHEVGQHRIRLYNVTYSQTIAIGNNAYNTECATPSTLINILEFGVETVLEIHHRCSTTKADVGFGLACNYGVPEVYGGIVFQKLSEIGASSSSS